MENGRVARLRQKGAEMRLQVPPVTWKEISIKLGILTAKGKPNPGLAYRIIMEGYIPKNFETQVRIGIEPVCSHCGRHVLKRKSRRKKSLFDFSKKDLLKMFNERKKME